MLKYVIVIAVVFFNLLGVSMLFAATDLWTQKADFGGAARDGAVGFSIGSKGYIGTAGGGGKDFWEYDPATDTWTQKADFGGTARLGAVGFSIGDKGYIGTGFDYTLHDRNDFWEYDPALNTWIQKADFPGAVREFAVGFSIGSKGYIGTGIDQPPHQSQYKDFWEYDPLGNTWTQKADFGGTARSAAVGFSIGSKGYVGTGGKDFWEYDPVTNVWTQKADFGGTARSAAVGFSIGSKGYVGTGQDGSAYYDSNDFWEYDPATDAWTQKANFGGARREWAVGFSIGSKGYVGTGSSSSPPAAATILKDFWEYDPSYLYLSQGWNFVSTPVQPSDSDIAVALRDISSNLSIVWAWNGSTQTWLKYRPSQSGNTLTTFEAGKGYWVYMNSQAQVSFAGTRGSTSVPLAEGWNLIGYSGQDNTALTNGLQSLNGKWSTLWGWNAGIWSGHNERIADTNLPAGISPLTNFRQWRAYWIKIKTGQAGNWAQ